MIVMNLRKSRERLDFTQTQIAEILERDPSTVSGWENGKDTIPLLKLIEYANEFDLSLDYLFGIKNKNTKYKPLKIDSYRLSLNLRKLREKNHMTQEEVASKLNTTQSTYSGYERNETLIKTTFLYNLTKIYKPFSIDKLLEREKVEEKHN